LLLNEGELQRDRVAFSLWPDAPAEDAKSSLRRHVHMLAGTLPQGHTWIKSDRRTISWEGVANCWVDVAEFQARIEADNPEVARELYRGDLLLGIDDDWILPLRERYQRRYCSLLYDITHSARRRKDYEQAIEVGSELIAIDPWREDVVRTVMQVHAERGARALALRLYGNLTERLRDDLGVEPSAETNALYAAIVASGNDRSVVTQTLVDSSIVLPATSFHGREGDVGELSALLPRERIVTLVGPGGVGKTRLAVEVAGALETQFRDRARVIDLANLRDGARTLERIAQALGVREEPGTIVEGAVLAELRAREMLLVLDNCEHLLADVARTAELIVGRAPGITILATSREPLRISAEVVYRVAPLRLPSPFPFDGDDPANSPAVQLFVDRALARNASVDVTRDAKTIAGLCNKLDGLPLAIEIAAANLPGLTLQDLMTAIDERLASLAGWRTAAPRQRTLEAVFIWSFELLSERLRDLFIRLSIFRGGFSIDAASAVQPAADRSAGTPAEIAELVERSLLAFEDRAGARRYRLLETTRSFAHERLAAAGFIEVVEELHARYFAAAAENARNIYETSSDESWFPQIYADYDNYIAVLERTLGRDRNPDFGSIVTAALADFWLSVGQESTALRWLETAGRVENPNVWCLLGLVAVYRRSQMYAAARALGEELIPQLRGTPNVVGLCRALVLAGSTHIPLPTNDLATIGRGRRMVQEALELANAHNLDLRRAEAHFSLATIAHYCGEYTLALAEAERAQAWFKALGKMIRYENTSVGIALIAYDLGDFDRACNLAEGIVSADRLVNRVQLASAHDIIGAVWLERGDVVRAKREIKRALTFAVEAKLDTWVDSRLARMARIEAQGGNFAVAARLFGYVRRTIHRQRFPRDRMAEREALRETVRKLGPQFRQNWKKGYAASRAEVVAQVLG
jgi:predicted ATPase/DNA-binding SARP family transcriptional activator